jgi:hypothetical protein
MDDKQITAESSMSFMDPNFQKGGNNKQQFADWIKRRLGYPQIRLELTDSQIYDAMQEALQKYVAMAERPVKYYSQVTTAGVNVYPLPDEWVRMTDRIYYLPNSVIATIQTYTAYNMYLNFTGNLDITTYEVLMENLQLKLNRIGATPTFEIIYDPPRLKVYPAPTDINYIVYAYVAMPRLESWTPSVDMKGYFWTRDYALALSKFTLGRIRSRYGDTVVAGEQTVNQDGAVLIGEAKEELAKLDEELLELRTPCPIIMF